MAACINGSHFYAHFYFKCDEQILSVDRLCHIFVKMKSFSMKKILLLTTVLCLSLFLSAQTNITYTANTADIINPERGFCEYSIVTVNASNNFTALTPAYLATLTTKKQSILLRSYYITPYLNMATIPAAFITKLQADLDVIRNAGFKVILRISYKEFTGAFPPGPTQPYGDAPVKATLLSHINQLKATLLANSDVIMLFESGFWGLYGENYYTDFYGNISTQAITPTHIADRKEIIDAMFTCVGPTRKLAVRTPPLKAAYYNQALPADTITIAQANNGTGKSRVGGYNDCFLADFNDFTYADTTIEKPFWAAESRYTVMGGETCADNATYTNCTNAQKELKRFNWTFCNDLYNTTVLSRWNTNGCLNTIKNNLGYRFVLVNGTYSNGTAMDAVNYSITLRNDGYAAPINPYKVQIVFKNTSTAATFSKVLTVDPRLWFGGSTITLAGVVNNPTTLTTGNYAMSLKISDTASTLTSLALATRVKYSIQAANTGGTGGTGGATWDATNGVNNLLQTVNLVAGSLPIKITSFTGQMVNNSAKIDWKVENDITAKKFELEFSTDGINFRKINEQNYFLNTFDYTGYHTTAINGKLFYRLKTIYNDGGFDYSNIISLFSKREERIEIKSTICHTQIELTSIDNAIGNIFIFNGEGKLVYQNNVKSLSIDINCSNWARGTYFLNYDNRGIKESKKIIVN